MARAGAGVDRADHDAAAVEPLLPGGLGTDGGESQEVFSGDSAGASAARASASPGPSVSGTIASTSGRRASASIPAGVASTSSRLTTV